MNNWINIKDKLPNNTHGNKIWACSEDGYQFEAEADEDGVWCSVTGDTPKDWMPLPEPPHLNF